MMEYAQTLAVWGSPGAGKTVTAVKLALELAAHKKNTILLLCDFLTPTPQVLKPNIPTDGKSLGDLLTLPSVSQDAILAHCIPFGNSPYLSLLGYQRGDNAFTYAQYAKERAVDLLTLLRHLADNVIIDVSGIFPFDILSATALESADAVLRLCACDLKSMSYMAANLPLLADSRFSRGAHIRVLSAVKPGQDSGEYENAHGGVEYVLPFVPELEEQFAAARLMDKLCTKAARKYTEAIGKIARTLLLDATEAVPAGKKPRFMRKGVAEEPVGTSAEFRRSSAGTEKPKKSARLFGKRQPEIGDGGVRQLLRKGGKR